MMSQSHVSFNMDASSFDLFGVQEQMSGYDMNSSSLRIRQQSRAVSVIPEFLIDRFKIKNEDSDQSLRERNSVENFLKVSNNPVQKSNTNVYKYPDSNDFASVSEQDMDINMDMNNPGGNSKPHAINDTIVKTNSNLSCLDDPYASVLLDK